MPVLNEDEKLQLCLERDRLLCTPEFARSPTMSKLLRFLVDHKLLEESKPLTAYTIAVDALGRDDGFDTQIDSYPRVQIGRLRRMLDHFYLREPSENRLAIPYNHYEIFVRPNEPVDGADNMVGRPETDAQTPDDLATASFAAATDGGSAKSVLSAGHGRIMAALLVLILAAIGALYYSQRTEGLNQSSIAYPSITVTGPEDVTMSSSRAKIQMTHSYLIGALKRFDQLRVLSDDADTGEKAQYVLETSLLNETADRIQLRLIDRATREVIWSSPIKLEGNNKLEADLDRAVIAIASLHGKIAQHDLSKYRGDYSSGYPCLLQFQQFLRYQDRAMLKPALQCMEISAKQFPDDAYLMSMLVVAKNISKQYGDQYEIDGVSKDFALKAATLNDDSASATFAVAQSAFFEGDCHRGLAWGERAVRLNPLNSRIMGYLGLYMLACNMPGGEAHATRALQIDPDADLTIVATLAMQKLRRGDAKAAQQLASQYMDLAPGPTPGLEISYILSTATLGDKEEARRAWRQLAKRSNLPATASPGEVLGKWMSNPLLIRQLESDFAQVPLD
ncbi:hypothetical protein [Parasphingorhabdus sp.]|uniref:hypothetical protein n=1 Tax=Parasphingorhabdus sp. TaxID=2709688 RepID=UPI003A94223C